MWFLGATAQENELIHPNTLGRGWVSLFNDSLTNAIFPPGVWTVQDGVLTASKDEAIWSEKAYDDFMLDLEFRNAPGSLTDLTALVTIANQLSFRAPRRGSV